MLPKNFIEIVSKHFQKLLLLFLLIILFPYVYLSFFSHPVADDYNYSFLSAHSNLWEECWQQYLQRNGRYSSNILVLLNPLSFYNYTWYKAIPILIIVLSVGSFYFFFRAVTYYNFSRIATLNSSIFFLLLYLFQMPSLAEGIYWYTGSVSYQAGIIVSLIYFGLLCNYFNGIFVLTKNVHIALSALFLSAAIGFNEVIMLLLVSFHVLISVILVQNKKKIPTAWWMLVIICFISSFIVILAPGNAVRVSDYPDSHHILRSLAYTFLQIFRFGFQWISNLPMLLISFLFIQFAARYFNRIYFFKQLDYLTPRMILVILFGILFVCIFPAYWFTNILGQHRTVNVAYFFFILFWFTGLAALTNRYIEKVKVILLESRKFKFIALLLALLAVATTQNGYDAFLDIFYKKANRFNTEMNERYNILSNPNNKEKIIYLKPLSEKPKSLFVLDLTNNSASWINSGQADYFGVKEIICKE